MAVNYKRLVFDLSMANTAAREAVEGMNDGGTANLDCVFLRIPHASESKVLAAIKESGLYCRTKTKWIGNGYFITPTCAGQGDTRTRSVEVMKKYLVENGWDAMIYSRMD